jgi:putative toxin-antitoxin system antitoxin component (TIGR02293 family)
MIAPQAIALILGIGGTVSSLSELDGAVSRGLSKQSVTRLVSRAAVDPKAARALRDQVVPLATWKRTKGRLSATASERAERLARVVAAAEFTMEDTELAKAWLNRPHGELHGLTPLAAARTELGARAVEGILDSILYGLPV